MKQLFAAPRQPVRELIKTNRFLVWLLVLALAAPTAGYYLLQRGREIDPTVLNNSILLFALRNLNVVLILIVAFVLVRNLTKLWIERRRQRLGAKFRTKLILTYIGLSLIPGLVLFAYATELLQGSIDRMFRTDIDDLLAPANQVSQALTSTQQDQLLRDAERFLADTESLDLDSPRGRGRLAGALGEALAEADLDYLAVYRDAAFLQATVNSQALSEVPEPTPRHAARSGPHGRRPRDRRSGGQRGAPDPGCGGPGGGRRRGGRGRRRGDGGRRRPAARRRTRRQHGDPDRRLPVPAPTARAAGRDPRGVLAPVPDRDPVHPARLLLGRALPRRPGDRADRGAGGRHPPHRRRRPRAPGRGGRRRRGAGAGRLLQPDDRRAPGVEPRPGGDEPAPGRRARSHRSGAGERAGRRTLARPRRPHPDLQPGRNGDAGAAGTRLARRRAARGPERTPPRQGRRGRLRRPAGFDRPGAGPPAPPGVGPGPPRGQPRRPGRLGRRSRSRPARCAPRTARAASSCSATSSSSRT